MATEGEFTREGQKRALLAAAGLGSTATGGWLALCTADPGKAPTMADLLAIEVTTGGYARQAVTETDWSAPTDADPSVITNDELILFGPFDALTPVISHIALVTSASGVAGSVLMKWTLATAKQADVNESIQVLPQALSMACD